MNYRYLVLVLDRYGNRVEHYHLSRSRIDQVLYEVIAYIKAKYNQHFELIEDHYNHVIMVKLL